MSTVHIQDDQRGQGLLMVLLLGGIMAMLGYALANMVINEMRSSAKTQRKDLTMAVGDAALQRSVAAMTNAAADGTDNWSTAANMVGFNSISLSSNVPGTPFTDIDQATGKVRAHYWIKIVNGDRIEPVSGTAITDASLNALTNTGDLALDRTVFVRVSNTATGQQSYLMQVIHRNDVNYTPGGDAISANSSVDTAGWGGDAFDGCLGAYAGTANATGTVVSPSVNGSGFGSSLTTVLAPPSPPPPPASTYLAQENPLTFQNSPGTGNLTTAATFGPVNGGGYWKFANFVKSGNTIWTFDTSRGPIHLYITGNINLGGNPQILLSSATAKVTVDNFDNATSYNTNKINDRLQSTSGTAVTASSVGGGGLSITYTTSTVWWSNLTSTAAGNANLNYDLRGLRVLRIKVKGKVGGESFNIGLRVRNCLTCSAFTEYLKPITDFGTLTTAFKTIDIPIDSLGLATGFTNVSTTASPMNGLSIVLKDFAANGTIDLQLLQLDRYGNTPGLCCQVADAIIYVVGSGTVDIPGTVEQQVLLYCPESDVTVGGGGNGFFNGAIIAKNLEVTGGGAGMFHYDACLASIASSVYKAPPVITNTWRQIGQLER